MQRIFIMKNNKDYKVKKMLLIRCFEVINILEHLKKIIFLHLLLQIAVISINMRGQKKNLHYYISPLTLVSYFVSFSHSQVMSISGL